MAKLIFANPYKNARGDKGMCYGMGYFIKYGPPCLR